MPNNSKIVDLHCKAFPTAQNFALRDSSVSYIPKLCRTIIRIYTILCHTDTISNDFILK